jgi:putative spermidine/putrescine transport system permease protein
MKHKKLLAKIYMVIIILIIYLPVVFMILLSFKSGANVSFPIEGFTLDWFIAKPKPYEYGSYISVMYDRRFFEAFTNSFYVSGACALLTCFIVTSTALTLRRRVPGRDILFYLILLGFIVPGVTLGLGVAFLYRWLGLEFSFWTPVFLDTVFAVPFGLVLMMARFEPKLMEYEMSASCLKASPLRVARHVTLPLIIWEVVSAGIMGFLLAWSEIIRTQFVMKGTGVLSTYILTELEINPVTPKWYAAGTIITAVSIVGLVIFAWILSRGTAAKK